MTLLKCSLSQNIGKTNFVRHWSFQSTNQPINDVNCCRQPFKAGKSHFARRLLWPPPVTRGPGTRRVWLSWQPSATCQREISGDWSDPGAGRGLPAADTATPYRRWTDLILRHSRRCLLINALWGTRVASHWSGLPCLCKRTPVWSASFANPISQRCQYTTLAGPSPQW